MANIFHITSVHQRYDTRIFKKECISLAQAGHTVFLIVCDGLGDEIIEGVNIVDIGIDNQMGRLKRFLLLPKAILQYLLKRQDIDYVHFHDPELIFVGKKLAKRGFKVIYDVHEYVPRQIMTKPYLPKITRKIIAWLVNMIEMTIAKRLFAIVSVTDELVERFKSVNKNVFLLRNYPVVSSFQNIDFEAKKMSFIYAGGITFIRGALEMAQASTISGLEITCFGPIEKNLEKDLIKYDKLILKGKIPQESVFDEYRRSSVGLITLHKIPNHMVSSPNKLFEYMVSGMAVIASDIPFWKEMVEAEKCGICVDPYNVNEIAQAMIYMKEHPEETRQMGMNGRKAVLEKYSWESEVKTLLSIYT